jgi:hypothetical protein
MIDTRERVRDLWEEATADFLAGRESWRHGPLAQWRAAYSGPVDLQAMAEPFIGPLFGQPTVAFLSLHPGASRSEFQHRGGVFPREIVQEYGTYTDWAASWPYLREPWRRTSSHYTSRLRFLRDWCGDLSHGPDAMLDVQFYPWHLETLTAPLRVPPQIVREYILDPVRDAGVRVAFAFGADWFHLIHEQASQLGLRILAVLGPGGDRPCPGRVASRSVLVARTDSGLAVIAEKKRNLPSPPASGDALLLREEVGTILGD